MSTKEELNSVQIALDILPERHFSSSTSESDDYSQWCVKNIFIKECTCFVPAKEGRVQKCGCGLLRSQHKDVHSDTSVEWSSSKHTRSIPTNAFGGVSFSDRQQDALLAAMYIRLSDSTSMDRLWYLIKNHWKLKPPTLIISIVGGNSDVQLDLDIKRALEDGLTKVINQTDVWLLTGATGTSITHLAAKVFKDNYKPERWTKNACIGIAPWGSIPENDQLVGEMVDVIYAPASNMLLERQKLNVDHTHFLLVDNGTIEQYGTDRAFRVKLERFLCDPLDSRSIPSVNLLVHGGYHACMQIKENLNGHPNIPTVVVKGSGGLADILANAHKAYTEGRRGLRFLNWITNELYNASVFQDHPNFPQLRGAIKEILEEHSSELNIYDPKGDPYGLDHAIMEACKSCSAENLDVFNRLQLAMHLDHIDAARSDIQQHGADEKMLYKSIKKGKATFVELLLNYGVDLDNFLGNNKRWLEKLYKNKIKDEAVLTILLEEPEKLKDIDCLLDDLLDGDYTRYYDQEVDQDAEIEKVIMTSAQQLIIWAVLTDMIDVVEVFWKFDTEKALENALIIFRLYKAMSKSSKFDDSRRADLMSTATKYETLSVELLSYNYKQNAKTSVDIVQSRIALWGYKNMVTLAANGSSREFVAHICCQRYLKDVWLGKTERKTLKSEAWKLKQNLLHPRKRLPSTSAQYYLVKSKKRNEKPGEGEAASRGGQNGQEIKDNEGCQDDVDGPVLSRRQKFGRKIAAIFRFLFFVPKGKLFVHEFIFTIFLGCFAYFVLVKKGLYHDILRYVVFTMVTALTIDEIREISEVRKRTLYLKLNEWRRSGWNALDCTAMLLFYTGFILGSYGFAYAERTIMAVDLMLWVFKFAQFYRMFYTLGPYLIMIYQMMFHMIGFVLVLLIAVVAYGIFMHTLLFPDVSVSWEIIFKLLFRPYLLVFGELGINSYALSSTTTVYGTKKVSEATEITVVIGMCIYLLVANVLLLNMLIAVFNNIYDDIKNNSDKIWRFDKYDMIMEYRNKPMLPIPLSVLTNVPMIFLHICRDERRRLFRPEDVDHVMDMKDFQNRCTKAYLREGGKKASVEEKHDLVIERTDSILKSVIEIEERMEAEFTKLSRNLPKTATKVISNS